MFGNQAFNFNSLYKEVFKWARKGKSQNQASNFAVNLLCLQSKMTNIRHLLKKVLFVLAFIVMLPYLSFADTKIIVMGGKSSYKVNTYININSNINECFQKAAEYYGVNKYILEAIAETESGMSPYALDVRGKPYFPKNIQEAEDLISRYEQDNPDIGIMQVNAFWFKKFGYPLYYGLMPCFDIYLGASVLRRKIDEYGNSWYGIASYHSADPSSNIQYAWLVYKNLKTLTQ